VLTSLRECLRFCALATTLTALGGLTAACAAPNIDVVPFLTTPRGFHVTYVSKHVPGARFMAFAPNGDLIVSETDQGNVVVIHPGSSPNALPDEFDVALPVPHGVAFSEGKLFVATWFGVLRYDYPARRPVTLFNNMPKAIDHNLRALAIAGDGSIFITSGSYCNVCVERNPRYATILRYGGGDTEGRIYARGLRNASGIALDPKGRLWATVNQRDNIGPTQAVTDNLPPDELDLISAGRDYGFPQCYPNPKAANRLPNPEYPEANCSHTVPATLNFAAHSAPLGIVFYEAHAFPAAHRGNAFVAFHGSWNRSTPTGDKVVEVTFKNGKPVGYRDFVTGWMDRSGNYRGRPVGLAVGPDGALYISDDQLGYIYRVTFRR
jgi:glucose/arabinose dehydrogenase